MKLELLQLFLSIVEHGSLSAAGRALGLSATTVSERLGSLEAHYGTRLLHRTTRALRPTDAGRTLLEGAPRVLAEAQELHARIRSRVETLSGPLRISAPVDLGRRHIAPHFDAFLQEHAGVQGELLLSDGYVDLIGEGVDIAVRFGALRNSSLRVRRLAESRRIVCASPMYLAKRGTPCTPEDLSRHACLLMRFGASLDNEWPFRVNGATHTVVVRGRRVSNDGSLVRAWCVEGRGIARKSFLDVKDDLAAGRLVELLGDYAAPPVPLQLVFPQGGTDPRRVRAFVTVLSEAFRS